MNTILTMPKQIESLTNHMLVQVKVNCYGGKKSNRKKAGEYSRNEGAKVTVMSVSEDLFVDDKGLHNISKYRQTIDNWLGRITYPWGDKLRLLPAYRLPQFMTEFDEHKAKFSGLVDVWLSDYDQRVADAAFQRGHLFNRGDYHTVSFLRSRFAMRLYTYDVPKGDFRVQCEDDLRDSLLAHFEQQTRDQMQRVLNKQSAQLIDVLNSLSKTCDHEVKINSKGERKVIKGRLHEVTFNLAKDLCETFRELNLTADPALESARASLASTLDGIAYGALKQSDTLRAKVKADVDNILTMFGQTVTGSSASEDDDDDAVQAEPDNTPPKINMLDEVVPEDKRLTADQRHAFNALVFSTPTEPDLFDISVPAHDVQPMQDYSAERIDENSLDDLLSMF